MNAYLVLPLVQTVFCLVLAGIVLKGHRQSPTHRLFTLYLLALAIWGIIIFGMRVSPDADHAFTWERMLIPLTPLLPVIFYHFSVRYTAMNIKRWLVPSAYAICLIFALFTGTDLVIRDMRIEPFGYAPNFGPVMPFWLSFSYAMLIMALVTVVRAYRTSAYAEQRNRLAYIIIGIIIFLFGGTFDILPALGLPLYPGFIICTIFYCLLTTVAIVRHNLLDIRIVLRKGIAYILTSGLIAIPFVGIFLLITHASIEVSLSPWAYILVLIILALALPQLWQVVQRRVDRLFYRDRYDYLRALEVFSRNAHSITDCARLASSVVNLLAGALRTSSVQLLQPIAADSDFATAFHAEANATAPHLVFNANSPLVKWLGSSDDILSCEDIDIIPQLQSLLPEEKEKLEQARAQLIAPLKERGGQLSGLLILGKKLSGQPYTVEDKQLIYAISNQVAINLENARLYTDAVRARENLEMWLNSMSDCVMIVNTDCVVQFMNKAAAENFSSGAGDICWRILGRHTQCPDCPIERYLCNNRQGTLFVSNIGGREYDVAVAPLLNPDGSMSIVEVLRDISERKQAEEREKQLQEELNLSSRLAAIGELAAGVAHEINNPLTVVLGFSERLARKVGDEKASRDLEMIHSQTLRASKVVQNLLTFARPRQPERRLLEINEVLRSALELRSYELRPNNIEATLGLAARLPRTMADFHQMQEVFLNIILNAEQAMTEANRGGKLSIKTQEIKGCIRISFTDNGPGISSEHLSKLFNPFFTTRGERGGTGLGLGVCHSIVSKHGGKIYVRSKLGKGTTFFVELPVMPDNIDGTEVIGEKPSHGSE